MSILDMVINALFGVPSPSWSATSHPLATRFDDPAQVSAAWLARKHTDANARRKDPFETTTEYCRRMATPKELRNQSCTFLLTLDYEGASFDADSQMASLRARPFEFNCPEQLYNRLFLTKTEAATGSYRLQNRFGAEVAGQYLHSKMYVFQISNFRALAALRRKRRRSTKFSYPDMEALSDDQLEGFFALDREYARSELPHLRFGARVCLDDVSDDKGYTYGGDDLDVPDTHQKVWVILRGAILALDVINIRTRQHLGGWDVHNGS